MQKADKGVHHLFYSVYWLQWCESQSSRPLLVVQLYLQWWRYVLVTIFMSTVAVIISKSQYNYCCVI